MKRVCACAAAAIALLCPVSIQANWGSVAGGSVATGNFKPYGTAQVEMLKEDLHVRLHRNRASVEVNYIFHNTAGAVDIRAGFPSLGVQLEDVKHHEIEEYTISVDKTPVSFTTEKGDPAALISLYDAKFKSMGEFDEYPKDKRPELLEWLASTVHFDAGQTRKIHITYESLYAYCSGGYSEDSDSCDDRFAYVLATGAAWKGPIVDGQVTIEGAGINVDSISIDPKGRFQKTGKSYTWKFHNLKPAMADNIVVSLNNRETEIADYEATVVDNGPTRMSYYVHSEGRYSYLSRAFLLSRTSTEQASAPMNVSEKLWDTYWIANNAPGIGESLTLTLKKSSPFDQIGVVSGCSYDKRIWSKHARIKSLEVTVNQEFSKTVTLPDEDLRFSEKIYQTHEWIDLPAHPGDVEQIRLTIRSVYPGKERKAACFEDIVLRKWLSSRPDVIGVDGKPLP